MASSFGIIIGPLSSVKNYADDTKVQMVLLEFGEIRGLFAPSDTNQDKLDAIVDYLEDHILQHVRRYERNLAAQSAQAQIEEDFSLE